MANDPLTPTAEDITQACDVYAMVFSRRTSKSEFLTNPMIAGRAKLYALVRQYPEVGKLLSGLNLDAPRGFGAVDVGLPNDPTYVHVLMDPETFLAFALKGDIQLDQRGYPDYIGTERLRD